MQIIMLKTMEGSPDGIRVFRYMIGEEYPQGEDAPMSDELAEVFIREGWATPANELGDPAPDETAVDQPDETRAVCGARTARGGMCTRPRPCPYHDR